MGLFYQDTGCVLCRLQFDKALQNEPGNKILANGKFHFVICGLGAFVPGYALLVTHSHIDSFSRLSSAEVEEYTQFRSNIEAAFIDQFGKLLIYEHGGIGENQAGGCVSHAHLHFMATEVDLIQHLLNIFPNNEENENDPIIKPANRPYLYVKQAHRRGCLFYVDTPLPRQFLRREIATLIGMGACWDYRLYPFLDNVDQTERALFGIDTFAAT